MLSIICFSKNRPWQLKEYLRSAIACLKGEIEISVLYACDRPFVERYQALVAMFPQVQFCREAMFDIDVLALLHKASDYVMFGVDDAFWYRDFNVNEAIRVLKVTPRVFGYHVKLHPGLTVCQTFGNVPQRIPPMARFQDSCVFDRHEGTFDWNYPVEIIATVYRKNDVMKLLTKCRELGVPLRTPNRLEGEPAKLFMNRHPFSHQFGDWMACASRPTVSVISVNCVQEDQTTIFGSPYAKAESLNKLFDEDAELDEAYYRGKNFPSVHIGDFILKH